MAKWLSDRAWPPIAGSAFLLIMLLCFCGGLAFLVYGPKLESAFAGFGVLLAIPFAMGALATGTGVIPFARLGCLIAPLALCGLLFPLAYFGFGEGLICIVMVLPFWLAAGIGGGISVWIIGRRATSVPPPNGPTKLQVSALLTLPFVLVFAEEANPVELENRQVSRDIVIAATADDLWPLLVSIPNITAAEGRTTFTHDFLGIPRPTNAQLIRRGNRLVRKAHWGPDVQFEERISVLAKNERISWDFAFPDDSVQKYTDRHISPDGPLVKIASGGYKIERLDQGRVRLTLTTKYRMRTRMAWYFGLWGEQLLGDVQSNVLDIIKQRAENSRRIY